MDLVEIRRKAGRKKQGRKDPRPEPSTATKVEESAPEPKIDAEAVMEPITTSSAPAADDLEHALETRPGEDALEQLFTAQQDLALATEESYLQAFRGGATKRGSICSDGWHFPSATNVTRSISSSSTRSSSRER
ncbi:hypothetical protein [Geothermobacter hydrogeniphilus]|uniref:hypothetical protein n=1 Tax=Geothermobacter hydrogeniphilus TaxID=1969733 RepID=UPI001E2B2250|nr:hypothetical protein [Geothermobacter hydrogeniphilus]